MADPRHPINSNLVRAAQSWLGTPYVDGARLKGVGTDCLNFIAGLGEDIAIMHPGAVDYDSAPFEFWINDPTFIEDNLAAAEPHFLMGAQWDILDLDQTRSLWWLNESIIPGDIVTFGTQDLPEVSTHAVLADAVSHQLMRFIHAWNPVGGGGTVRHGVLGKYFRPFRRYRIVA
jgi:hypothetical protein